MNQQFKELSAIYHKAASLFGISDNEFWVWYALLVLEGDQSQQSICELWSLPKQTVNSVVSDMIKKGHIYLEAIPGTRNKKIRLTDTGKEYGNEVVLYIYNAEQRAMDRMSQQEQYLCTSLIAKYSTFLNEEIKQMYDEQTDVKTGTRQKEDRIFTIPNLLSLFRLCLIYEFGRVGVQAAVIWDYEEDEAHQLKELGKSYSDKVEQAEKPKVLYLRNSEMALQGNDNFIKETMELAGADNVAADVFIVLYKYILNYMML